MTFREEILAEGIRLICGDCREVLKELPAASVDACVTDPPYHLVQLSRNGSASMGDLSSPYGRSGPSKARGGFMGKTWDGGDIAFRPDVWREVLRVLKPGGHLLAFSGTRTYHRMACAVEDAGFEIRDQIGFAFGSGFPKSHNLGNGWGTALKPAWEPIVLARKPLIGTVAENVLAHGTGAINVDGCRVEIESAERQVIDSRSGAGFGTIQCEFAGREQGAKFKSHAAGRWPANLIHDGSAEVVEAFPDAGGGSASGYNRDESKNDNPVHVTRNIKSGVYFGDSGSAARFFYTAKADVDDRLGSKHPTVKPLDLMQYLVRMVTPKGGIVLDCFAGTGTTGEAAFREGMRAVLIERELEYQSDIRRRMSLVLGGQDERRHAAIKASGKVEEDPGPLFNGLDARGGARDRTNTVGAKASSS